MRTRDEDARPGGEAQRSGAHHECNLKRNLKCNLKRNLVAFRTALPDSSASGKSKNLPKW